MPFDSTQLEQLNDYKSKVELTSLKWGLGMPAFMGILSFIPSGLIPHRNAGRVSNPDASLADMIGVPYLLLGLLALATILLLYFFNSYRYFKIRKDLAEQEMITFQTRVREVVRKGGGGMPEIELKIAPPVEGKYSIEFIDFLNFPFLSRGQTVEITASKHALFPFSISKVNQESGAANQKDDIQAAMDLIKKLKDQQQGKS